MIKIPQTLYKPPSGNCLAACVASIFELPLWLVPNFIVHDRWEEVDGNKKNVTNNLWWEKLIAFAHKNKKSMLQLNWPPENVAGVFTKEQTGILTVQSQYNKELYHCIVVRPRDMRILWDPNRLKPYTGYAVKEMNPIDLILFF